MSYFSQSKGGDTKTFNAGPADVKLDTTPRKAAPSQEIVSTLGPGLLITGNVVSTGAVQVHGRIIGDIHAATITRLPGQDIACHIANIADDCAGGRLASSATTIVQRIAT